MNDNITILVVNHDDFGSPHAKIQYNDNSNIIINMCEYLQCIPEWKVKFIKNLIFSR